MRLIIMNDADKVSEWAAKYVVKRIKDFNPGPDRYFVLGLPTGNDCLYYPITVWSNGCRCLEHVKNIIFV